MGCPLIDQWYEQLEQAEERVLAITADLSPAQANWKPAPERWSVAECIEHLNVIAHAYLPGLRQALLRARELGQSGSAPYGRGPLAGRFLLNFMRAGPSKRKVRTMKVFRPSASELDPREITQRFHDVHQELRALMREADGLDLARARMRSPASRLLSVSAAQAFEMLALHAHRHLDQAERVRSESGFPAAD
jgi:hypothetical protein